MNDDFTMRPSLVESVAANAPATPLLPHLEGEGLAAFELFVAGTPCLIEYGSGGSTLHAVRMGARHVVSVDSSKDWIVALQKRLQGLAHVDLLHCDVGAVGEWGRPIGNEAIRSFHAYMEAPWKIAEHRKLEPRLIFIDGRFRVACFLYSLICAPEGAIILFDDYLDRARYHVVEEFCERRATYGRMAMFQVDKSYSLPALVARIAEYSINPD